ncbi:hypothetical protein F441_02064 [Phytophthora nicotianae CJ01A1]|uniref:Uncharacterized protein n=1 Tax=Phytophthora nicotianae CJ01A1 TaxID=1317063 RepID=W2XQ68_PHYNI|nr:hypothetical protein F441_02064 [Phytophthora nicotianae CJ01A1]
MPNVTSWTETEISAIIEAWSEVEAKYPLLTSERGKNNLHSKMYALYSRRVAFPRTPIAVLNCKQHIREFVLFVAKYDKERQEDGDRLWFELSVEERRQRRGLVPRRPRGLATSLSKEAFAKLLKMERVQRWLGGDTVPKVEDQREETQEAQFNTSFIAPEPDSDTKLSFEPRAGAFGVTSVGDFFPLPASIAAQGEELEEKSRVPVQDRSDTSTCSLYSNDEASPQSTPESLIKSNMPKVEGDTKKGKTELQPTLKHRDCNLLLEKMMKFQNKTKRRAVAKLRAEIEREIHRNSEMLLSIVSNQFEDPENSADVAFLTQVLNRLKQQVQDRFDQFDVERTRQEAANRALLSRH